MTPRKKAAAEVLEELGSAPRGELRSRSEQLNAIRRARAQLVLARTELRSNVELGDELVDQIDELEHLDIHLEQLENELEDDA